MTSILKLKSPVKDYIWGGNRLIHEFGMESDKDILAEAWTLSCHPDGASLITGGVYNNLTLPQYIEKAGTKVLGTNYERFSDFPILVKLIDAKDDLSIQVHPNNEYAMKHENQYGKTEMWYVVDCAEDAYLYYGVNRDIDKEEFRKRIEENTLLEILNKVAIKKGDVFFIESGTIHAICKNTLIAEIQQNSNVTYRVYDYGRAGTDGKTRELHIDKAIDVSNLKASRGEITHGAHIATCEYFTVDKLNLDGKYMKKICGNVDEKSFLNVLVICGEGELRANEQFGRFGQCEKFKKGDSFFISAGVGEYEISGNGEFLLTYIL